MHAIADVPRDDFPSYITRRVLNSSVSDGSEVFPVIVEHRQVRPLHKRDDMRQIPCIVSSVGILILGAVREVFHASIQTITLNSAFNMGIPVSGELRHRCISTNGFGVKRIAY